LLLLLLVVVVVCCLLKVLCDTVWQYGMRML